MSDPPVNLGDDAGQILVVPPAWLDGDFAAWLQERMDERGLTQRMLALRSGVNHSTISRLINSNRQPNLSSALALLRVLAAEPVRMESIVHEDAS